MSVKKSFKRIEKDIVTTRKDASRWANITARHREASSGKHTSKHNFSFNISISKLLFKGLLLFVTLAIIVLANPTIDFQSPTASNGSTTSVNSTYINISTNDSTADYVTLRWNNTFNITVDSPSLVFSVTFEENSTVAGGVKDKSRQGNNMTTFGSPYWNTTSRYAHHYSIAGGTTTYLSNDKTTGGLPTGNAPRTMEIWFRTTIPTSGNRAMLGWGAETANALSMLSVIGNKCYFSSISGDVDGATTVNDGLWHHCAFTYDGAIGRIWKDGVLETSTDIPDLVTVATRISVGGNFTANFQSWNGDLFFPRVWNRNFSAAEVNASFMRGAVSLGKINTTSYYANMTDLANGTYWYDIVINNTAGAINTSILRTITISTVPQSSPNANPTVTIVSPANTTYINTTTLFNWTVTDVENTTLDCTRINDTTSVTLNGFANNTYNSTIIASLNEGLHNVTVSCSDGANTVNANVFYTIKHFNLSLEDYRSTDYETNRSIFTVRLNIASNVQNINASLIWNTTSYNMSTKASNSTQYNFTRNLSIPLIETNNTAIPTSWNFTITFTNGTSITTNLTTNNQNVLWAYMWADLTTDQSDYLERDNAQITGTITKIFNLSSSLVVNLTFNNTIYTTVRREDTITQDTYNNTIDTENSTTNNYTLRVNGTLYVSFNGTTLNRQTSVTRNVTIFQVKITDCSSGSGSTNTTINFTVSNEITRQQITSNVTFDITFLSWGSGETVRNNSFNKTEGSSWTFCIHPSGKSFTSNATINYDNGTNTLRTYYIVRGNMSNTVSRVNLYLLQSPLMIITEITVKDVFGNPKSDNIIKIQRFYNDINAYLTVAMAKTNINGLGITRLHQNDAYYKFLIEDNGLLLEEFPPELITADPTAQITVARKSFTLSAAALGEAYKVLGKVSANCNNTTTSVTCTVSDGSNLMQSSRMVVKKRNVLSWDTLCDTTLTSSGATHTCSFGASVNGTITYTLTAKTKAGNDYLIETGTLFFGTLPVFALTGVFVAMIITLTLAFIGLWNPQASIGLAVMGIIISVTAGFLAVSLGAMVGLVIVAAILILRMR